MPDPDVGVVAVFRHHPMPNPTKSKLEGRPIFDDLEVCDLRYAGSRNMSTFPALAFSHWTTDPQTGEQVSVTYAERFRRQYGQFKTMADQTKAGTPLGYVAFLTEARRAELRALNIYTIEALAAVDGQELKNLGMSGRDLKNKAIEFIDNSRKAAPDLVLRDELEQLKARNTVLETDVKILREKSEAQVNGAEASGEFDHMSLEQLREYVTSVTGHAPHGSLNRKTLLRMAAEVQPKAA